jgi:hypothetical protein
MYKKQLDGHFKWLSKRIFGRGVAPLELCGRGLKQRPSVRRAHPEEALPEPDLLVALALGEAQAQHLVFGPGRRGRRRPAPPGRWGLCRPHESHLGDGITCVEAVVALLRLRPRPVERLVALVDVDGAHREHVRAPLLVRAALGHRDDQLGA